ncbi:unnamed protein product [Gulo gulo]|uniref:Uncharacterized protein n=1 Tax=Gulo gulo TaxID=48420 RepID=A0A9X9LJ70_GULGU|nr:unnamed protein product [Gulo gulo]
MECDSQPKRVGAHVGPWTRLIEGWFVGRWPSHSPFQHVL